MATVICFEAAKARMEVQHLTALERVDRQIRSVISSGQAASSRGDAAGVRRAIALLDLLEARETGLRDGRVRLAD
jgi:hypothetical protein